MMAEAREKEREAYEKMLGVNQKEIDLKQRELDLANEKWKFYQEMYTLVSKKKGGVKCFLKKFFTLWILRC